MRGLYDASKVCFMLHSYSCIPPSLQSVAGSCRLFLFQLLSRPYLPVPRHALGRLWVHCVQLCAMFIRLQSAVTRILHARIHVANKGDSQGCWVKRYKPHACI